MRRCKSKLVLMVMYVSFGRALRGVVVRRGFHRSMTMSAKNNDYDVVVIGGGHAGCEAAAAVSL
jgi:ribulose 1,5-bisphosphate synthetase/thiazole synthase